MVARCCTAYYNMQAYKAWNATFTRPRREKEVWRLCPAVRGKVSDWSELSDQEHQNIRDT